MSGADKVYVCLYDLEKVFDLVKYPVLLYQLYGMGINRKLCRLLKDWYCGLSGCVRLNRCKISGVPCNERHSPGSVLSPVSGNGSSAATTLEICLKTFYHQPVCWGYLHADSIQTLASSLDLLDAQVLLVHEVCEGELEVKHMKV